MELQLPSLSLMICFPILLFFIVAKSIQFMKKPKTPVVIHGQKLPPEPWKLPLIGHLHHLAVGTLPHLALRDLARKHGPIFRLQLGEVSAIVISSPELAKEVMQTHDLDFANRPQLLSAEIIAYNYTDIAFSPYGDYWRQMRKICTLELLSARKVRSLRCIREGKCRNLTQSIHSSSGSTVNLSEKIFTMENVITCRAAIGDKCNDQEALISFIKEIISLSGGFDLADLFPSIKLLHLLTGMRPKLLKVRKKMDQILNRVISEHQERRAAEKTGIINQEEEDLLDVLMRHKDDGGLDFPITSDNIKAVIFDIFAAGTDTSSATIEWAMSEMIRNPRVMVKAQAELRQALKGKKEIQESDIQELSYLKLVIKETLRLHPPVPLLLPRECRNQCEIGGYNIRVKTKVIINSWTIGRHPDYWIDAESFIPERFSSSSIGTDFEYLPFGAGRRMCPGQLLGLANVELPLAQLLYHFDWKLECGNSSSRDLDMSENFGATLTKRKELLLVPTSYTTN